MKQGKSPDGCAELSIAGNVEKYVRRLFITKPQAHQSALELGAVSAHQ